jgi:hypothetical protein
MNERNAQSSGIGFRTCTECGVVFKNARAIAGHLRYGSRCRSAQTERYRREFAEKQLSSPDTGGRR